MKPSDQDKGNSVLVEISVGELLDKITILELKAKHFVAPSCLTNVNNELADLNQVFDQRVCISERLLELMSELRSTNRKLWQLENEIRRCERDSSFDSEFIEIARSIYITNDTRADVKKQINEVAGSRIVDEKNYCV